MKPVVMLLLLFFTSQMVGLFIVSQYIDFSKNNTETVSYTTEVAIPEIENKAFGLLYIISGIFIATLIMLIIIKFKQTNLWRMWFFLSVSVALYYALWPFVEKVATDSSIIYAPYVLVAIVAILAYLKLFTKIPFIHNGTELFIYGGLCALLLPILNVWYILALLIIMSVYDYWMTLRSKHMVVLAQSANKESLFAGLVVQKEATKTTKQRKKTIQTSKNKTVSTKTLQTSKKEDSHSDNSAILGGGDMAFPLLYASSVMAYTNSFWFGALVSIGALIGLAVLFRLAQKNAYYPALPLISAGAIIFSGCVFFA